MPIKERSSSKNPYRPASRQWPPKQHVISCGTSLLYPRANSHRWVGKLWRDHFQLGFPPSGFPHLDSLFYYYLTGYPHPWGLTPERFSLGIIFQKKTEIWSPNVPLNSMVYGRYNYLVYYWLVFMGLKHFPKDLRMGLSILRIPRSWSSLRTCSTCWTQTPTDWSPWRTLWTWRDCFWGNPRTTWSCCFFNIGTSSRNGWFLRENPSIKFYKWINGGLYISIFEDHRLLSLWFRVLNI